jgi:hypothetical protein
VVRAPVLAWLAVLAAALALPPPAQAHVRSGVVATDYLAFVSPLAPALRAAFTLKIYKSDRALGLTVRPQHKVVVIGYVNDRFLRLDTGGVAVNASAPTASSAGLLKPGERRAGRAAWLLRSPGRTIVWHDARVRSLPGGVDRARWKLPLIVDGRRAQVTGWISRVPKPSLWPWLALGAPFVATAIVFLRRRWADSRARVTVILGCLAAAGTVATALAFALASSASQGRWVEAGNELVLALVGLAVLARGSGDARAIAGGALGLLALLTGLTKLPVLLHGVVLSALPGTPARMVVSLTIWSGIAATTVGLVVFFEMLERDEAKARAAA